MRAAPRPPNAIMRADTMSRSEALGAECAPDVILRVGQVPTSTPLRAWLARHGKGRTLLLDATGQRHDPDDLDAEVFRADPAETLRALADHLTPRALQTEPGWAATWRRAEEGAEDALTDLLHEGPVWAGAVARALTDALPQGGLLHVASSLAVRAVDAFGGPMRPQTQVTANRGVNGIDGTLATALGQAAAWRGPTAVLLGDLAFLHDLGSLATVGAMADGGPMVVVVLDNGGGGLFDHLPIAAHPTAHEAHFVTRQGADIPALGRAMTRSFATVADIERLSRELTAAFGRPGLTILHVPFERAHDLERHRRAWAGATGEDIR